MIYLFIALYPEAKPLIHYFQMKKNSTENKFEEFVSPSEDIRLVLTGVGSIAAATAVSSICTKYSAGKGDFLVNLGICAGNGGQGDIYLCNKIIEEATGRTFYPDILYRHPFQEAAVITETRMINDGISGEELHDMEAAAVYQAGSYFFAPHQMSFLKAISDNGNIANERNMAKDYTHIATELISNRMDMITMYLYNLKKTAAREAEQDVGMTKEECARLEKLCVDLHASQAMKKILLQDFHYLTLSENAYRPIVDKMYSEGKLPCKNRREGKACFEELRRELL